MAEAEIYALLVIVTYKQAARAHGIGPKLALQLQKAGKLPFPVLPQGRHWVTTKAQLLESLNLPTSTSRPDPVAMTSRTTIAEGATPAPLADDQADELAAALRGVARDVEAGWVQVTIRIDVSGIQEAGVAACGLASPPVRLDVLTADAFTRGSLRPI